MYNHTTCGTSYTCALVTTILDCVLITVKKMLFLHALRKFETKKSAHFQQGQQAECGRTMVMAWVVWRQHGVMWR